MTGIIAQNVGRTSGLIKAASGGGGGAWTKIKTLTSDGSDSDLTFVNGTDDVVLDSTYSIYKFVYINTHPETDGTHLQVGFRDGGSAYDATMTTTYFRTHHGEDGGEGYVAYREDSDLAQSTSPQRLGIFIGADADQCCSGELNLFAPSDTTFVKHFIARTSNTYYVDYHQDEYIAGYCNVTAAIDAVQFSMSADEIQGGKIKLYGLKDSA